MRPNDGTRSVRSYWVGKGIEEGWGVGWKRNRGHRGNVARVAARGERVPVSPMCVSICTPEHKGSPFYRNTNTRKQRSVRSVVGVLLAFFLSYPLMEPLPRVSEQEQCGATKFLPSAFRSFLYQTVVVHPQSHLKRRRRKQTNNFQKSGLMRK